MAANPSTISASVEPVKAQEPTLADQMYPQGDATPPSSTGEEGAEKQVAPVAEEKAPLDKPAESNTAEVKKEEEVKAESKDLTLKLPEKSPLKAEHVEKIVSFAKEQGLSQDQAQKLLERESSLQLEREAEFAASQQEILKQSRAEWEKQTLEHKELGGENLPKTIVNTKRALDRFGTPEIKNLLNATGFGNHPAVVDLFNRIGAALGEDKFVSGSPTNSASKSFAHQMYPDLP